MMIIRKAALADLDAIEQIYQDIHTEEEAGRRTVGWIRGVYPTRTTAEESILRGDMFVLEEGIILGAAIINRIQVDAYYGAPWAYDTDDVCVLHTLVISPEASGRGYGKAFVDFYEKRAAGEGLYELRIDTNARNTAARAMYRKLGYKEIGIVPTVFNGIPGVDLVLLEKNLKDATDDLSGLKIIRATETWQQAGAYYVRIQAMARKHHISLRQEFDDHDSPETEYIVVTDQDFPVATARMYPIDRTTMMIGRVVVLPEYRRRGIGTMVVRECELWAREKFCSKTVVESRDNKVGFYEAMGYKTAGEMTDRGTFPCIRMEKNL